MDAVPSLCASSASCGAAALGFAFGQYRPDSRARSDGPLPNLSTLETPIASRPLTSAAPASRKKWRPDGGAIQRPHTASAPSSTTSLGRGVGKGVGQVVGSSGLKESEVGSTINATEDGKASEPQAGVGTSDEAGDTISRRRSWLFRLSSITTSSQDGSVGSLSAPRPSTPSILSNGSSSPFFANTAAPTPANPRNRLVKRSASQRVLQTSNLGASPYPSPTGTPPLRRPATSHQRSEHLRLQNLQYDQAPRPQTPQFEVESRAGKQATDPSTISAGTAAQSQEPQARDESAGTWKPFFHYRVIKVGRETFSSRTGSEPRRPSSRRSPSASVDVVRCCVVEPPSSTSGPALVLAPSVQKPSLGRPQTSTSHSTYRRLSSHLPWSLAFTSNNIVTQQPQPDPGGTPSSSAEPATARSSFSISDLSSYLSPSIRRRPKRGREERRSLPGMPPQTQNYRSTSAPLPTVMADSRRGSLDIQEAALQHRFPVTDISPEGVHLDGHEKIRGPPNSPLSSSLPQFRKQRDRMAQATSEQAGTPGPGRRGSAGNDATFSHPTPINRDQFVSNGATQTVKAQDPSSRVPSDHDSAGPGSDHSHVFSDGDDAEADGRSDTVYDSVRTEATNSSHSGAKTQHIENLFLSGSSTLEGTSLGPGGSMRSSFGRNLNDRLILEEDDAPATAVPALTDATNHTRGAAASQEPISNDTESLTEDFTVHDATLATPVGPSRSKRKHKPSQNVTHKDPNSMDDNATLDVPDASKGVDSLSPLFPRFSGKNRHALPMASTEPMHSADRPNHSFKRKAKFDTPADSEASVSNHVPENDGLSTPTGNDYDHKKQLSHGQETGAQQVSSQPAEGVMDSGPPNETEAEGSYRKANGKANIFEWSETRQPSTENIGSDGPRPQTAHVQAAGSERGGRSNSRRSVVGAHLRSQSVPLAPEVPARLGSAASKVDAWILGNKGVSEDWDNDFEFEDESTGPETPRPGAASRGKQPVASPSSHRALYPPVVVPSAILEKQASVHGQFGQVKELTMLVLELRRLRHQALALDILGGQASELWKEAEGIIDLATLDEDEPLRPGQQSPAAASVDFDAFDEESSPGLPPPRRSSTIRRDGSPNPSAPAAAPPSNNNSPSAAATASGSSRFSTPQGRPRQESIAKAKHVLETISKSRAGSDPVLAAVAPASPSKKLPFDTTSLRDLVTRAGVVLRALKEVVRRAEDPDYVPSTPEHSGGGSSNGGGGPPRDPPFSQIFQQAQRQGVGRDSPGHGGSEHDAMAQELEGQLGGPISEAFRAAEGRGPLSPPQTSQA